MTLGVALYALFLVVSPLEHHDLVCHLRTPLHCTSCTSTALGADTHVPPVIGAWALSDAGHAVVDAVPLSGTLLPVRSSGRSPPIAR